MLKEGQTVKAQVLEMDREKRRIRLGMKQLEPTSADNFIAENKVGDTITGRVVDVSGERMKVELGEGVHGVCRLAPKKEKTEQKQAAPAVDVSALSAMLKAKWKSGGGPQSAAAEGPRAGQIRKFRIAAMDPQSKRIELELAD